MREQRRQVIIVIMSMSLGMALCCLPTSTLSPSLTPPTLPTPRVEVSLIKKKKTIHSDGNNCEGSLKSFLNNRKQCVRNGIVESDLKIINRGVPQGTVQRILVFILYVTNFSEVIGKSSNVLPLADDTTILCHEKK